ncbi:MAG: hypothetical protein ABJD97_11570 [Betaproteobacteria bacterium]
MLRELLRSMKEALPIVAGVAGPIFIASFALLAWAGAPPMKAVTLPWRSGLALWLAQAVLAAWPQWALRRRLLPEAWCVQLRCLPLAAGALWWSDVVVSAAVLAPLAVLDAFSVAVFGLHRPAWLLQALPQAMASLLACWVASCLLGAGALAWQRRGVRVHAVRASRAQAPAALLARRPRLAWALLWQPAWRGALTPGARSLVVGMAASLAIAGCWTQAPWPIVPGAVWALAFCTLLVALTERFQRTMELHLDALAPWLAALPVSTAWRWRARLLVCAPMVGAGLAAVLLLMASRPWRGPPLAAFAIGLVAAPAAMTAVPSANREAHVGLWAICVGVLTALGSELWN